MVMNKNLLCAILACILLFGCASPKVKSDIPEIILTRFNALYPKVENLTWEKGKGKFEASFAQGAHEFSVVFLENGEVQQTEAKVEISGLPPDLVTYVSENLKGKKIDEASRIVDGYGNVTWEAEVDSIDYLFSTTGQFIGREEAE
jgi:ABC-type amino acid transport substrate-binding protein